MQINCEPIIPAKITPLFQQTLRKLMIFSVTQWGIPCIILSAYQPPGDTMRVYTLPSKTEPETNINNMLALLVSLKYSNPDLQAGLVCLKRKGGAPGRQEKFAAGLPASMKLLMLYLPISTATQSAAKEDKATPAETSSALEAITAFAKTGVLFAFTQPGRNQFIYPEKHSSATKKLVIETLQPLLSSAKPCPSQKKSMKLLKSLRSEEEASDKIAGFKKAYEADRNKSTGPWLATSVLPNVISNYTNPHVCKSQAFKKNKTAQKQLAYLEKYAKDHPGSRTAGILTAPEKPETEAGNGGASKAAI
jgi:hypothetical protein